MLQLTVKYILFELFKLDPEKGFNKILEFFIYDSLKLIILLFLMIAAIGFLRSYVSAKKIRLWLTKKHQLLGYFSAVFFGAVTPFCTCSSIPIFISFIKGGIPLGVTFSFLITSPIINEYLVVIMLATFGVKITIAYVLSGLFVGLLSGLVLNKLNLEKELAHDIVGGEKVKDEKYKNMQSRVRYGWHEATDIVSKTWKWILFGVALGAVIHNYVPETLVQQVLKTTGIFSVPLAVLIGVPMYGGCAAIVPIAIALFDKGVPLGTALGFMMAVSALSLPEAIILRRVMSLKLIAVFFGIVTLAIIFTGYLFNCLQPILVN